MNLVVINYYGWVVNSISILAWSLLILWLCAQIVRRLRLDWVNRRCSPAVMPFAGIINAPPGMFQNLLLRVRNFTNCISFKF